MLDVHTAVKHHEVKPGRAEADTSADTAWRRLNVVPTEIGRPMAATSNRRRPLCLYRHLPYHPPQTKITSLSLFFVFYFPPTPPTEKRGWRKINK